MNRVVVDVSTGQQSVIAWTTEEWAAIQAAATPTKQKLILHAAAKRWAVQSGGVSIAGFTVDTSTDSLALITGAIEGLERGWNAEPIRFKSMTGWVDLSLAQLQAIGAAVTQHVQACFAAEAAVVAKINNDTYTTYAQIDSAAEWPAG